METMKLFVDADIITGAEADRLIGLETVIERGLHTFVDVGTALLEIRDSRLYRTAFDTFEDYCRERWGMSRPRAYQLIDAATVASNLSTTVDIPERHLRPLVALEPEEQRTAWQQVLETAPNGKVTAAHVERTIERLHTPQQPDDLPPALPLALKPSMAVHYSSETPEHYTPQEVIERVIACMGGIDLDPSSNSHETPSVPAAMHYTKEDNGLAQVWRGTVYMNPPYGREVDAWIEKLVASYETGSVTEAVALLPARTDTQWWQRINDYHVCFVVGRLTFIGNEDPAPFPSAVVYLGSEVDNFVHTFEDLGPIWHRTRRGYCYGE